jgi:thiol:disulfide interchange protein DsbD
VAWTFSAKRIADKTYEVHITATIQTGWHTYSPTTPDGGPVPTTITFVKNPLISVDGKLKEVGKLEKKNEPLFGVEVTQYSNKVDFIQVVKVKAAVSTLVKGTIEYMVCNDTQCLPPATKAFAIALGK